jgi:hypothetical protein
MFIASGQQARVTQHFCMHQVPKIATLVRKTVICGSEVIGSTYRSIKQPTLPTKEAKLTKTRRLRSDYIRQPITVGHRSPPLYSCVLSTWNCDPESKWQTEPGGMMDDHLIRKLRAAILKFLRKDTIIRLSSKSPTIPLISVAFSPFHKKRWVQKIRVRVTPDNL